MSSSGHSSHKLVRSALALATTLLFSSAVLAQVPPADPVPRKQGGFLANAGANCRGMTTADVQSFETTQDGMRNTSTQIRTLVCNQPSDEFARSSGNGTAVAAGLASFTMVVRNLDAAPQTVTCTGYAGRAGGAQFTSMPKTVMVTPGARVSLFWSTAENTPINAPFQRPTNIVCEMPPNMQANENSNRYFREVGDF